MITVNKPFKLFAAKPTFIATCQSSLLHCWRTVKNNSPILHGVVLLHLLITLISVLGMFIDDRMLLGLNVWVKPFKFSISGAIYLFTFGYLTTLYPFSARKRNWLNQITTWAMFIEIAVVTMQAARGVQSHFNQTSLLDGLLFAAMGLAISFVVAGIVFLLFESLRLKMMVAPTIQLAIIIGWLVVLFGSYVGGQMISQMSHTVGAADGSAGLPILSWSTVVGDLRVAHFLGLHAIQILPLFAFFMVKFSPLKRITQLGTITIFGLVYAAYVGFIFYQAKQAIPFISL